TIAVHNAVHDEAGGAETVGDHIADHILWRPSHHNDVPGVERREHARTGDADVFHRLRAGQRAEYHDAREHQGHEHHHHRANALERHIYPGAARPASTVGSLLAL